MSTTKKPVVTPTKRRGQKPNNKKNPAQLSPSTRRLLSHSEDEAFDFKRDAEAVKAEDLVAFANAGGGVILVGVDETQGKHGKQKGKVVGCEISDKERNKIVSRANTCRPTIPVKITIEHQGNLAIMRVDIPKGGLHCTANGTYKIRRDGQLDIIEPSVMAQIIVERERSRIIHYLNSAIRPEIENALAEREENYQETLEELDELREELEDQAEQWESEL